MIYFCNPSTPQVRAVMQADPRVCCIITPKQGNVVPDGVRWCADNGCFGEGYPGDAAWIAWLTDRAGRWGERCLFAVAPDVVGDHAATVTRSAPWLARIRQLGVPAAFVLQDGATVDTVPWGTFDVLFLGGSTPAKLGDTFRTVTAHAVQLGIPVHMGRVSSYKRISYAAAIGCTSTDGTFVRFGVKKRLPELVGWLDKLDKYGPPALLY